MATLVLQLAGAALGNAIGGPIGAMAGRVLGAVLGASIDTSLLRRPTSSEGPRVTEMSGLESTEGASIPRVYGRARIGGELIWATRFEEIVNVTRSGGGVFGGKGGLFGGGASTSTTYSYFANLAIGLCEGPIAFVRRVWADGQLLDLTTVTMRLHRGDESQEADPLVVAKEGAANAPAYRGTAYVVFERLPLADFGNRIPQFSFEVARPVGSLNAMARGVNLIPGAGEFAYETTQVFRDAGDGVSRPENVNQLTHAVDLRASLDQLQALCPNLESVTLIVTWFGDDLRAGLCSVRPKVEVANKFTTPLFWSVSGVTRFDAQIVSVVNGLPAYGGTPSDHSVLAAIAEIRSCGLKINLHPFIMMDIAADNALPDPWTGASAQPAYPWRGEITVDPAPGVGGTVDGSSSAATQIASFVGSAAPAHFVASDGAVIYSGPDEWTLRRLVLHCAMLAAIAGGVDAFILSSELRGLTRVRGAGGSFPMTDSLISIANDVRAILGGSTNITYAADWTEYGAIVPAAGELIFPLDALWASADIDMVGINWYVPLSDWRDGVGHADAQIANSPANFDYLRSRVASGEGYHWYYANDGERDAQIRRDITDGAYGKPWVYRVKDLANWWSNAHVARSGNVETFVTPWSPQSKPIWLTEVGCPAVDNGANGPNAFPDVKSASAARPPFSHGARDDLVAMRANAATLAHFDPAQLLSPADNPVSPVYGGRMVDVARTHLWAWDARPFPAFPTLGKVWGDAANYETGHWLNGRLEGAALDDLVRAIAADFEVDGISCEGLDAFVDGYVVDKPMSLRSALEPLAGLYNFGLRGGGLSFVGGRRSSVASFADGDLVPDRDGKAVEKIRAQETELPAETTIGFADAETDYRRAAASSRRLSGMSKRQAQMDVALTARRAEMQLLADVRLQEAWTARESVRFSAPLSQWALEAGDRVTLVGADFSRVYEIQRITDGAARAIEARAIDDMAREHLPAFVEPRPAAPPAIPGAPQIVVLDLPIAAGSPTILQYVAAFADPWPGSLTIWRKSGADFVAERLIPARATMGNLLDALPPGFPARWDRGSSFRVELRGGTVASIDDENALASGNAFAIRKPDGAWEIIIAQEAVLVASRTWRLSRLLRGLGGSEEAAAIEAPAGATIVRLNGAVTALADSLDRIGVETIYRIGPSKLDHGDARVVEIAATATPLALKPYSPVGARAARSVDGMTVSFTRRSRIDGDAWETLEIPLGEDSERYELDILDGFGGVKRTLSATAPSILYAAADEIADFGAPQTSLAISLSQVSAVVGRGFPLRATLAVA
ncbi:baseplate multidomain protein megatron [Terrarubrum flagellatum]|uniref:baseplate multidomain protein megatron n=1 Tax=Terrirubrum flagellatum TaxID=2895980 RepID=UPI0031453D57